MLVREGLRLEEPEGTPPALWQIIDRCWKSNLKERWKFVELTAALEVHRLRHYNLIKKQKNFDTLLGHYVGTIKIFLFKFVLFFRAGFSAQCHPLTRAV